MKTKLYELVISQNIKMPTITVGDDEMVSYNDSINELYNVWKHKWFKSEIDTYRIFYRYGSFNLFREIEDHPIKIKEFLLEYLCPEDKDITVIHRKHPNKQNVRQITLIKGKTDRPIHWID